MSEVASHLNLTSRTSGAEDAEITGGYVSDLLSDVLANAKLGNIWVTNQKHQNCIAVASLLGLAGLVIAGGVNPDENTIEKATSENVPLYTAEQNAFEVVGKLHDLGVTG
jgi:hypothetical protein